MDSFSVEIPVNSEKDMQQFQELMNSVQDYTVEYIENLAVELNVSEAVAMDVWYLRTRQRWSPELEAELIKRRQAGEAINMCDFGVQL